MDDKWKVGRREDWLDSKPLSELWWARREQATVLGLGSLTEGPESLVTLTALSTRGQRGRTA